jgi:hypothetical protein
MNDVEEALKDAMASRVAGVQAPPSMAQSIRRRNRRHSVRFRTAGAALVTAAVAGAVPMALHIGTTTGQVGAQADAPTPQPSDVAGAVQGTTLPDVVGMDVEAAKNLLTSAGLKAKVIERPSDQLAPGTVLAMRPRAGTTLPPESAVELTIVATPSTGSPLPQDLGDLGDGRTFGGIHLRYLPAGLTWGKWSGKDGFGVKSYTTTFVTPGLQPGEYSVQVVVFQGDAAANVRKDKGTQIAKDTYLATYDEGGQVSSDPSATRTITRFLRPDLAIEVMVSPDYVANLKGTADEELKKIARGVELS